MNNHTEDDSEKSTKERKKKSRHRNRTVDVEEEGGHHVSYTEDDDSDKNMKKRKKKSSTKESKKIIRHRDRTAHVADSAGGGVADAEDVVEERCREEGRKRRRRKKKKDKKRKRGDGGAGDDDSRRNDDDDSSSRGDERRSKTESTERRSKDERMQERRLRRREEMDERIVASSAVEYYPDDLKRLHYSQSRQKGRDDANAIASSPSEIATARHDGSNGKRGRTLPSSGPDATGADATIEEGDAGDGGALAVTKEGREATTTTTTTTTTNANDCVTLLLFYQYVEPPWDEAQFRRAYEFATVEGDRHGITGRMRVAREGMNCTLTGNADGVRGWCAAMRSFDGGRSRVDPITGERRTEFADTEFKLTDDLPPRQRFPKLHAFEVVELVNYGLAGSRAPVLSRHGGTHLEPEDYHRKMCESDTVIIDVRNHYEANIGRFDPPRGGARMIDPMMRKSTEFPMWLDKKETKEMLRGKQVLMYCTGGVRCERASALLKQKIDEEEDTKELGIKGVYQLQGGIDKYFKQFPAGGLWRGKNYVFDKRFAHAPPAVEAVKRTKQAGPFDASITAYDDIPANAADEIMGKCEACYKPWDMYRGKRRCPTCGVPSLICRECFEADKAGTIRLGKQVRCDLCVAEDVRSKGELRDREEREIKIYEEKLQQKLDDEYAPPIQRKHAITRKPKPNPERITRLFLKNMCAKQMDESKLLEVLHPVRVTHIHWLTDRKTGKFYGSAFIEVKTAEDAGSALALDGIVVFGRKIRVKYQRVDEKDVWPIPNTEVTYMSS